MPDRTRLSRQAVKDVPHRTSDRFYAAQRDAEKQCTDLLAAVTRDRLRDTAKHDLTRAVGQARADIHDTTTSTPGGRAHLRELGAHLAHLQTAEQWLAAAERVRTRLGGHGPASVRERLVDTEDTVLWCVRAGEWNGQLTAATRELTSAVADAETCASRLTA